MIQKKIHTSLFIRILTKAVNLIMPLYGILFFAPFVVDGQTASLTVSERIYVQLIKQVFVTGECIRYKVYLLNGSSPAGGECSRILYFNLTGTSSNSHTSWRINMDNRPVSGCYTLPADMKAGLYVFRAYTNLMRNLPEDVMFSQNILILNLSSATPDTVMLPLSVNPSSAEVPSMTRNVESLNVNVAKPAYSPGDKIRLEISLENPPSTVNGADVSVSVSSVSPFQNVIPERDIVACLKFRGSDASTSAVPCKYLAENMGYILSGRIRRRDNSSPAANAKILLSFKDTVSSKMLYAITDVRGAFVFYLNRTFDNKELYLQFADQSVNSDYKWEIDTKEPSGIPATSVPYLLNRNEETYLNAMKDLRLIEAVYSSGMTAQPPVTEKSVTHYFTPVDVTVYPAEYAELVNFKEIADNILPCVRFGIRNDAFNLQVFNDRTESWQACRMLLLNGVPFSDLAYIATLGTKDIKRIEERQ